MAKIILTENEKTAMDIYALTKEMDGDDIGMNDPEKIAALATTALNTVLHLGGLVERIMEAQRG